MNSRPPVMMWRRAAARSGGFTFVEMMLGLIITALIGLAISSMLFATAHGSAAATDSRGLAVQQKVVAGRMDAAIRGSQAVLASGSNYLVLWMRDTRANDLPDLSELRRIEYDSANHRVISYRMPATWSQATVDANEVNYTLSTDLNAATNSVKGASKFPAEVWSDAVYSFTTTLDAAVPDTGLIGYKLVVKSGPTQATIVGAAALRN